MHLCLVLRLGNKYIEKSSSQSLTHIIFRHEAGSGGVIIPGTTLQLASVGLRLEGLVQVVMTGFATRLVYDIVIMARI
jgi:hypothetical protein